MHIETISMSDLLSASDAVLFSPMAGPCNQEDKQPTHLPPFCLQKSILFFFSLITVFNKLHKIFNTFL